MKKALMTCILLAMLLNCGAAWAEMGTADVRMEGEVYHLVLKSVELAEGEVTVVIDGYGSTLRMGPGGAMIAGVPEARYGDETVEASSVSIDAGAPYTFTFKRDTLPDEIRVKPYDAGEDPVLIWAAADETEAPAAQPADTPEPEPTGEPPADETEAPAAQSTEAPAAGGSGTLPSFSVPQTPQITVPDVPKIKVPDVPEYSAPKSDKIEVPDIPKVEVPDLALPASTSDPQAAGPGDPEVEALLDRLGKAVYRRTYEALAAGEIIQNGSRGETARGVQQTLTDLGQKLSVDGIVGPRTLAALNAVQAEFGLNETDSLDAAGYANLLSHLASAADGQP